MESGDRFARRPATDSRSEVCAVRTTPGARHRGCRRSNRRRRKRVLPPAADACTAPRPRRRADALSATPWGLRARRHLNNADRYQLDTHRRLVRSLRSNIGGKSLRRLHRVEREYGDALTGRALMNSTLQCVRCPFQPRTPSLPDRQRRSACKIATSPSARTTDASKPASTSQSS